jgi:hypothetical protein
VQLGDMKREEVLSVLGRGESGGADDDALLAEVARVLAGRSGEEQAGQGKHVVGGPLALARNRIAGWRDRLALLDGTEEGVGEVFGEEGAYHGAFSVEPGGWDTRRGLVVLVSMVDGDWEK